MKTLLLLSLLLVSPCAHADPILTNGQYTFNGTLTVDSALTPFFPRLDNGAYYTGLLDVNDNVVTLDIKTGEYDFTLSGLEFDDEWAATKGSITGPTDMHTTIYQSFAFDSDKAYTMGEFELNILYKPFPIPITGLIEGTVSPFTPISQTVPEYQSTIQYLILGLVPIVCLYRRIRG